MCKFISGEPYLRSFIVSNKLSKAAKGKNNKAYDNATPFSKMATLKKCLSEVVNLKEVSRSALCQNFGLQKRFTNSNKVFKSS